MDELTIEGKRFEAHKIDLFGLSLMVIKGGRGFLACGYISIESVNKFDQICGIVSGVKSYEDMLNANLIKVSEAGMRYGIELGITGKEFLLSIS